MNIVQLDAVITNFTNSQLDRATNIIVAAVVPIGKIIGIVVLAYLILTTIRGIWRSLNRKKCNIKRIPVQSPFPFFRKKLPEIDHSNDPPDLRYASPQEYMAWQQKQADSEPKKSIETVKEETPKPQQVPKIIINVDPKKGIFRKRELTEDEIDYLKKRKYQELCAVGLESKKQDKYLVLPRSNEGLMHFFLCRIIADYIKRFTDDVQLYETKNPDIVFGNDGQKYAIEVETGTRPSRNPKGFQEKIYNLKHNYKDRWFFVVTDRKLKPKYRKWGRALVRADLVRELGCLFESGKTNPQAPT